MTEDEIIEMAIQLGFDERLSNNWLVSGDALGRFAKMVAAKEREACALICEELKYDGYEMVKDNPTLARKIRARGLA